MNPENPHILLVDDDDASRMAIEMALEGIDATIVSANSGKQALREILKHDFALIILDISMPIIDGIETAKCIRERPQSADTPIIFLTASDATLQNASRGYAAGAMDYISKPIVPEILRAKVRAFVRFYRQQQQIKKQSEQLTIVNAQLQSEIAERKKVEDALATINAKLETRVQERTAQIEMINRQLRQMEKIDSIGKLATGVAHDFNNILSVVLGYGQMALQKMSADDPQSKKLEAVIRAGERGAALTRQLLIFSRKQVVEPKTININSVIAEFEKMLRRLIGENIEMIVDLAADIGYISADPGQLEQVIMNLCVNSRDAMPDGGKLRIETANVTLDETHLQKHLDAKLGKNVMLTVSDTGCGMAADVQAHLFEPFFTTKEVGKGTGLGLSVVYGVVKQFGGHIVVESELNRGTTAKIYFPRVGPPSKSSISQIAVAVAAQGETVLIVDDEEDIRSMMQETLKELGYKTLVCSGARDAMHLIETLTEPLHLVITDMVMPEMSGKELVEHIKLKYPQIKTLYMSGYIQNMTAKYDVDRTTHAFIEKPFMSATLAGKIREALKK